MADYQSAYTGQEIDTGIAKANTAVQPADLDNYQSKIDSLHKLSADLISDGTTNKTVTSTEKTTWSNKQEQLISGTNIKTINNASILGEGNITISGSGTPTYTQEEIDEKIDNVAQYVIEEAVPGGEPEPITFSETAKYIICNDSPVNLSPRDSVTEIRYAIVDCTAGDKFQITGTGGASARLWCFINSSNTILSVADANASAENLIITAPPNTSKLIINLQQTTQTAYKIFPAEVGWNILDRVEKLEGRADAKGKTVAIFGDSIATHGKTGKWSNAVEMTIAEEDVGVELSAYLTYYDLYDVATAGGATSGTRVEFSLGGHSFTDEEIGTLVTFTPIAADVGKTIGKVYDWNGNDLDTWWVHLAKEYDMTPIPVCWASSSISSHEANKVQLKTSPAWHEAQLNKCGTRTKGTMTRTAPDYIIIARGCNDYTHEPYTKITENYFDGLNWSYPTTDEVTDGFGIKEAITLTVKNIRAKYPQTKIILATLPYLKRIVTNKFPANNGLNTYPQWNEAIKECADYLGCGLIDLAKDGSTYENIALYAPDGTHRNAVGHKLMGDKAIHDFAQYI